MDGEFNLTQQDLATAVANSSVLVDVSVGMWSGQRTDRESLEALKKLKGATGDVGTYRKKLMSGYEDLLKAAHGAFRAINKTHDELTLPFSARAVGRKEGPRLCPNVELETYLGKIGLKRKEAFAARDVFVAAYPTLVEPARANLGELADLVYPSAEQVAAAFWFDLDIQNVPATALNNTLPPHIFENMQRMVENKHRDKLYESQRVMWERVANNVGHLVERLEALKNDDKTRFFESNITHIKDMLVLLPGWNMSNDPRMVQTIQSIEKMLDGVDASMIRKNTNVLADVQAKAQSVMDQLNDWNVIT